MNKRVPIAICSLFLVAFVVQVVLKLSGVFIFEKALDWQVFGFIDKTIWVAIPYYAIFIFITMYCLAFMLTTKPYSKKWYHYTIMIGTAVGISAFKLLIVFDVITTLLIDILLDLIIYVAIPLVIHFTTEKQDRLFETKTITNIIVVIAIQILFYFCYLGLNFWSCLLNCFVPTTQSFVYASSAFLTQIEVYTVLITLMLSINTLIKSF